MRITLLSTIIVLTLGAGAFIMAQDAPETVADPAPGTYRALERDEIEAMGRGDDEKPPHPFYNDTKALTQGLNKLARDGWELIAIEGGRTRQLGDGTPPASRTFPATYIFRKAN